MANPPQAPAGRRVVLRGDYAATGADYLAEQRWGAYTRDEHRRWSLLYQRQSTLLASHAADAVARGLHGLDVSATRIPRLEDVSRRLEALTGWRLVGVPGLIPELRFFELLAARQFPVTVWLRRADELDYLAEPDLFHDFFGHVPLLADPVFADFIAAYGRHGTALAAQRPVLLKALARLYWYGVEFGLLRTSGGLRAFGAGILSSQAETRHAIESPHPLRVAFDVGRVLRSDYLIDEFQRSYFVFEQFAELFAALADPRFAARCELAMAQPAIAPGEAMAGDREVRIIAPAAFR